MLETLETLETKPKNPNRAALRRRCVPVTWYGFGSETLLEKRTGDDSRNARRDEARVFSNTYVNQMYALSSSSSRSFISLLRFEASRSDPTRFVPSPDLPAALEAVSVPSPAPPRARLRARTPRASPVRS